MCTIIEHKKMGYICYPSSLFICGRGIACGGCSQLCKCETERQEKIKALKQEIEKRETEMNEYWEELKKHDHTTYSYPFHQAKAIDELKVKLSILT